MVCRPLLRQRSTAAGANVVDSELHLFDPVERAYKGYRERAEAEFAFLNRSARADVDTVRRLLESWFDKIPEEKKKDIRSRFRTRDERQHIGALLELATHELLRMAGADIRAGYLDGKTPEYRATFNDSRIFVECTVVQDSDEDIVLDRRAEIVKKAIDSVHSGRFLLSIYVRSIGPTQPATRQLCDRIERWLSSLDADDVIQQLEEVGYSSNQWMWCKDGWEILVDAIPMDTGYVKTKEDGAIGIESGGGGWLSEESKLRRAVEAKARKYRPQGHPYLVVVGSGRYFADGRDMRSALLGEGSITGEESAGQVRRIPNPEGLFGSELRPRNRHLSAVLFKPRLNIWTLCGIDDSWHLIRNPWAEAPLAHGMFPFAVGEEGSKRTIHDALGIPHHSLKWDDSEPA